MHRDFFSHKLQKLTEFTSLVVFYLLEALPVQIGTCTYRFDACFLAREEFCTGAASITSNRLAQKYSTSLPGHTMIPAVPLQITSLTDLSQAPAMSQSVVMCQPAATPTAQLERYKHRQPCHMDDRGRGGTTASPERGQQKVDPLNPSAEHPWNTILLRALIAVDRATHQESCSQRWKVLSRWFLPPSSS